jgi:putative SOS response-associated peptidase YedK
MCGRFTQTASRQSLLNRFLVKLASELAEAPLRPRYNVAPTHQVEVVRLDIASDSRLIEPMKWGFVPSWSKESKLKINTINARSEKASTSPVYRGSFARRRCIVPISGYYEWKAGTKPKQPFYFFDAEGEETLAVAGLWDRWEGSEGGAFSSFTILTTEANRWVSDIHHRMPVLLDASHWEQWLDHKPLEDTFAKALFDSKNYAPLKSIPVSTLVNKVSFDEPSAIERYEPLQWDF